jgi:hypothetical protein
MVLGPGVRFRFSGEESRISRMRAITAGLIFGGGCLRARDLLSKMRSSSGSAPRIRRNHFLTQDRERPTACANSRWLHSGCAFRKIRKVRR